LGSIAPSARISKISESLQADASVASNIQISTFRGELALAVAAAENADSDSMKIDMKILNLEEYLNIGVILQVLP
jgi:hypothetical protein